MVNWYSKDGDEKSGKELCFMGIFLGKNCVGYSCCIHDKPSTVATVYQCGWQSAGKLCSFGPAIWNHFLIHYVVKGKGELIYQEKIHPVQAGQGFLITPGQPASYCADADDPWEYYWVGFNGIEARNMLKKANLNEENPIFTYDKDDKVKEHLENLYHSFRSVGYKEYAMIGHLYLFLSCIAAPKIEKSKAKEEYIKNATEYIENNYFYRLTVQNVAQHVGVEHSYLFRIFKEKMGCSISTYISNRKIDKAKMLLSKTNMPITEIANSLNFSSIAHFSKAFKKATTVSPMTYRKMFSKQSIT